MRSENAAALVQLQHDLKDLCVDVERMRDQIAEMIARQKAQDRKVITDVSGQGQPRED